MVKSKQNFIPVKRPVFFKLLITHDYLHPCLHITHPMILCNQREYFPISPMQVPVTVPHSPCTTYQYVNLSLSQDNGNKTVITFWLASTWKQYSKSLKVSPHTPTPGTIVTVRPNTVIFKLFGQKQKRSQTSWKLVAAVKAPPCRKLWPHILKTTDLVH